MTKNAKDTQGNVTPPVRRSGRGFAGMDPQRQREIAAEGGRAAHVSGNAHQFTSEEAREAGRKGGEARAAVSGRQRRAKAAPATEAKRPPER